MLPLHGGPSTGPSPALSRLVKHPQPFSKLLLRWIILLCSILAFLFFFGPFLVDFLRPSGFDFYPSSPEDVEGAVEDGSTPKGGDVKHISPPPEYIPLPDDQLKLWAERRDEVKEAMSHAWKGYMDHAFPADELKAISGDSQNNYNGWSVTLYDSLDTLWIMGLKDEFNDAVKKIEGMNFTATKPDHYAPFFETTIRYLGGTLSAYALSKDPVLKDHADKLGQLLLPAFRGTPSGLPAYSVHVESGTILPDQGAKTVLFAEATTCQLEFKYLAKITGNKEYYQRVQKAMNLFYKANVTDGLFHDKWLMENGKPDGQHFTIGATADSGYEYLLKQWLLSGDEDARIQYLRSINGMLDRLIHMTPSRNLLYAGDITSLTPHFSYSHRLEHLSCYLPGLLALGAHLLPLTPHSNPPFTEREREMHLWAARGLGYTCAVSYGESKSGLGPDQMSMPANGKLWKEEVRKWREAGGDGQSVPPGVREPPMESDSTKRDYGAGWPVAYLLRPETVESIFYLYKATGDIKWRERGYDIFKAINKHTRTEYGFASVHGVDSESPFKLDEMPSWFLAETLKYLYLLMDDDNTIPLDKFVFNTEAHPLPIFEWTKEERKAFGVEELSLGI